MRLPNLLDNLTIGKKQEVGAMAVYPLIGKDTTCKLASFKDLQFQGTSNYGEMDFYNASEHPFILPTGYTILTKQAAQDHATTFVTVLPSGKTTVENACCVQQTQCGYIDGFNLKEDFKILPLNIRKNQLKKCTRVSSSMDFSRLWSLIVEFQRKSTNVNVGNLIEFFDKFAKDLDVFNAEFESVKGQRGAIITFNDKIVGIEVAPTEDYWNCIWKALIRDSYGAEVVRLAKENIEKVLENKSENYLDLLDCKSFEEISTKIKTIKETDLDNIKNELNTILNSEVKEVVSDTNSFVKKNSINGLTYKIFKNKLNTMGGELVLSEDEIIYLSILV